MRSRTSVVAASLIALTTAAAYAQTEERTVPLDTGTTEIKTMVSRLELEKYKATIKGLTQFGDRRQGTDRNRAAVDWIEAQLKSYGGTPTERVTYKYEPAPRRAPPARTARPRTNSR